MSATRRLSPQQKRVEGILDSVRDKEARPMAERRHLLRLWNEILYPMRWRLLFAILLTTLLGCNEFAWSFMHRYLIDVVLMVGKAAPGQLTAVPFTELVKHIDQVIGLFFINSGIHISMILLTWQSTYNLTLIGQRVVFDLRKSLHERLQVLPLSYFDQIQTGRLLSVVIDDVQTIQHGVANFSVNVISQSARFLINAGFLFILNWKLAFLALVAIPFYVLTFRHFRPRIREGNIAARRATALIYARIEERISAVRTIKVFGREKSEVKALGLSINNLARLSMHIVRLQNVQQIIAVAIAFGSIAGVLYLSIQELQAGRMSAGQVWQFYILAGVLFQPANMLADLTVEFQRIGVVLRRAYDLLEADPEPPDRPDALALADARGEIAFDDITFAYAPEDAPTLTGVSFRVPAGKQVAVMGPSGAGKSSLLYLLMRFYDPDQGAVTLDGNDLRDVKLASLRDRITLVMQEPVIFSGTVAENIRYGRLEASDAEVRRAAKDADLHQFIQTLPDGYDTVVGERGMSLSGGQRQRLALAASLISRPSVLLLDDTTSALDAVTEVRVRTTLNRVMKGRTCFVVTHRVSTAIASDLVLVLEDGTVTQFGTPHDLLQQEGLFRRIYEQQQRESADEAAV